MVSRKKIILSEILAVSVASTEELFGPFGLQWTAFVGVFNSRLFYITA